MDIFFYANDSAAVKFFSLKMSPLDLVRNWEIPISTLEVIES